MQDQEVISWLVASMEPHIAEMCTYQETATEVWEYLQETYDQNQNFSHIYNLKQELQQIKQGNRTNSEYLAELKRKLEELKMYLPPTTDHKEIQKRARVMRYIYTSLDLTQVTKASDPTFSSRSIFPPSRQWWL
jgi:predicted CopG family antitoxin